MAFPSDLLVEQHQRGHISQSDHQRLHQRLDQAHGSRQGVSAEQVAQGVTEGQAGNLQHDGTDDDLIHVVSEAQLHTGHGQYPRRKGADEGLDHAIDAQRAETGEQSQEKGDDRGRQTVHKSTAKENGKAARGQHAAHVAQPLGHRAVLTDIPQTLVHLFGRDGVLAYGTGQGVECLQTSQVVVGSQDTAVVGGKGADRKSTRLNSSHAELSRMPSSA